MGKRILIVMTMVMGFVSVYAQPHNTARLSILSGGHLEFTFNSIAKYKSGITYTNGTVLGITVCDIPTELVAPFIPGSTLQSWDLDFNSFMAQPTIDGDAGNTLPLGTLECTATNVLGMGAAIFNGTLALSALPQTLVTSGSPAPPGLLCTDWSTHQIGITYDCGTNVGNNLLNETADYYTVEIEYSLIPGF